MVYKNTSELEFPGSLQEAYSLKSSSYWPVKDFKKDLVMLLETGFDVWFIHCMVQLVFRFVSSSNCINTRQRVSSSVALIVTGMSCS